MLLADDFGFILSVSDTHADVRSHGRIQGKVIPQLNAQSQGTTSEAAELQHRVFIMRGRDQVVYNVREGPIPG